MLKKALAGIGVVMLLAVVALFFFARSILASDTVRAALAEQLSSAIGQPVSIASIDATIFPRITVNLGGVGIGQPVRIQAQTLHVGADFRALLSRRIEHASLRLDGARIELPLPALAPAGAETTPASPDASGGSAVEIVSIDEVVLRDVEIRSAKRTLRADIEAVPKGNGIALRKAVLRADDTAVEVSGEISDLSGPTGELALKADRLNIDNLLAFFSEFAEGAGMAGGSAAKTAAAPQAKSAASGTAMNVVLTLDANQATLGALVLDRLSGRAQVTDRAVSIDPVAFGLFKGRYEGTMVLALGEPADFRLKASLQNIDMASAAAFAGSPDTITGQMSGRIELAGRGLDAAAVGQSARGTIRADIKDGVVKNLGLLRAVVLATSMRAGATDQIASGSTDEPFSLLGGTLRIGNGTATTDDLRFESRDLSLQAAGSVALNGSHVDLSGKVQLSEALSQQAGSDLQRYTQEGGRVTLPVTVRGSVDKLSAGIDTKGAATRALKNRAAEEAEKQLKGLGGLFR
jgi:uncharacterized protein involved in outer membrane biogenesis